MTRAWRIPSHDTNKTHWIYFAPDTADRCIPLLAKARLVVLPLVQGEHGLLEVHVPQGNRGLVAEAHRACRSGQPLRDAKNAVLARSAKRGRSERRRHSSCQCDEPDDAVCNRLLVGVRTLLC